MTKPSKALVVPDPLQSPVPRGWFEDEFAPALATVDTWDELDDVESNLKAVMAGIDSFEGT